METNHPPCIATHKTHQTPDLWLVWSMTWWTVKDLTRKHLIMLQWYQIYAGDQLPHQNESMLYYILLQKNTKSTINNSTFLTHEVPNFIHYDLPQGQVHQPYDLWLTLTCLEFISNWPTDPFPLLLCVLEFLKTTYTRKQDRNHLLTPNWCMHHLPNKSEFTTCKYTQQGNNTVKHK